MIIFETVSKQFGPDHFALQEVSFEVPAGELTLLTGPSGSGKTTIMRLLTREYTPTTGEIFLEDLPIHDIKQSQIHNLRRKIGVVFQDYRLLPELNVWENIALPLSIVGQSQSEIENRVTDLLRLVKLTDKALLFPRQLSGGEAQRISIARALAIGPQVIFADEPTGNLDPETSITVAKLLKKIQELGTTVILATHDTNVLDHFSKERVIRLDNGKLVTDSTAKSKPSKTVKKKEDQDHPVETDQIADLLEATDKESSEETNPPKKKGFFAKLFGKKKQNQETDQPAANEEEDSSEIETAQETERTEQKDDLAKKSKKSKKKAEKE